MKEKGDTNNVEAYQKEHAAAFLEAGADLVLGGHSDRLQGMDISMENQLYIAWDLY